MTHHTDEEWVDFVNETMTGEQMNRMRAHLGKGCRSCTDRVQFWLEVRKLGGVESDYQPPVQAVRSAKNLLPESGHVSKPGPTRGLLLDSFLQLPIAGTRAACTSVRQLLFRAGGYQIDLRVEPNAHGDFVLVGQICDASNRETSPGPFHVVARDSRGSSLHTASNENGEFCLEMPNSHEVELILIGGTRPIVISLGDPLLGAPRERR